MSISKNVSRVNADIEQALGIMRTQITAFRRTASPEIMANYPRLTGAIGRYDFLVTQERSLGGIKEPLDEAELLAWDVPQLLESLFTEAWMQQCFTANDIYPDTVDYHIHDYLRRRGRAESPFPAYFAEELNKVFYPLGRLLKRSGYAVGSGSSDAGNNGTGPSLFPNLTDRYKMHPSLIAGATLFGEQARRCYELREQLKVLELELAEEEAKALWDKVEAERKKRV